jgi:hypothetical protein
MRRGATVRAAKAWPAQSRRSNAASMVVRILIASLMAAAIPARASAERYALIVSGASGGQEYAQQYVEWIGTLSTILLDRMKFDRERIITLADTGDERASATAANVRRTLTSLRGKLAADDLLIVVLIGHGTFDGVDAKFNLVGPDLESSHWLELLAPIPARLVLVNTTAGSFPFIERLSGERRIVVTATDSLAQRFDTVFPGYFIEAFRDERTDIDKNGRVSIWEAFFAASNGVRRHYQQRGQLATERALLDDNGDGVGREASSAGDDGSLASRTYLEPPVAGAAPTDEVLVRLLQKRASLEVEIEELQIRRRFMPNDEYRQEFERLIIELSRTSREIRERVKS